MSSHSILGSIALWRAPTGKREKPALGGLSLSSTDLPNISKHGRAVLLGRMLIVVDALAHVIGFAVELALVGLGEMAVVLGHVFLFVVLQMLLTFFQVRGLPRGQLTVLNPVGNPVLLASFAAIDLVDPRVSGIDLVCARAGSVAVLRSRRSDEHQTADCQDREELRDSSAHERRTPTESLGLLVTRGGLRKYSYGIEPMARPRQADFGAPEPLIWQCARRGGTILRRIFRL